MSNQLIINVACSEDKKALEGLVQVTEIFEKAFSPLNLHHISVVKGQKVSYEPISDLKDWLLSQYIRNTTTGFIFLDPQQEFRIQGNIQLQFYDSLVSLGHPPPEVPIISITLKIPYLDKFLEKGLLITQTLAENCQPYHIISQSSTLSQIQSKLIRYEHDINFKTLYNLPPFPGGIRIPREAFVPKLFTWVNYWSKETAEYIDWSEDKSELFYHIEHTEDGGLILQLTEQPLTMNLTDHQDALRNAYLAFPKIGGRYWAK